MRQRAADRRQLRVCWLTFTSSLPRMNVEVVGGSRVLKVVDGRCEDHGEDLQLTEPVL